MRFPRLLVSALVASIVLGASPSPAATAAKGSASASNAIVRLSVGSTTTSVAVDRAASVLDAVRSASAGLDVLSLGAQTFGGASWDYGASGNGQNDVALGTVSVPGVGSVVVAGGSVGASSAAQSASASATAVIGAIDAVGGGLQASAAETSSATSVTATGSSAVRTLSVGTIKVLSIRSLLQMLAVDPTSLDCGGIEAGGLSLGVATSQACPTVGQIQSLISDAQALLNSTSSTLTADLVTATSTIAGLTIITPQLLSLAGSYGINLSGLLLGSGQRTSLIDEITARLDAVTTGLSGLAAGTCSAASSALGGVTGSVPSLAGGLNPIDVGLDTACTVLQGILDSLLDTSLITIDAMEASLSTLAGSVPASVAGGSFGAIHLGTKSIALAGLTSGSADLDDVVAALAPQSSAALSALGIGAFPVPEISLLAVTNDAGTNPDGSSFAQATITGVHIAIPSVSLSVPSGSSVGSVLARRPSSRVAALPSTSPAISLDVAVFEGDSRFTPASAVSGSGGSGGGGGAGGSGSTVGGTGGSSGGLNGETGTTGGTGPLASTGLRLEEILLAGMLALLAGWRVRRVATI